MLEGQKGWSVRCVESEEGSYEMEETHKQSQLAEEMQERLRPVRSLSQRCCEKPRGWSSSDSREHQEDPTGSLKMKFQPHSPICSLPDRKQRESPTAPDKVSSVTFPATLVHFQSSCLSSLHLSCHSLNAVRSEM